MPYVNFKEENYKLDKQIKNRKENNKKIIILLYRQSNYFLIRTVI